MLVAWNEDPLLHLNLHQVIHLLFMTSDYPTPNFWGDVTYVTHNHRLFMEVSICTRSLTIITVDRSTLIIPNRPMFLRRECVIRGYIHHIPLDLDTPMSMLGLPIFVHPRTPRPWSYPMNSSHMHDEMEFQIDEITGFVTG